MGSTASSRTAAVRLPGLPRVAPGFRRLLTAGAALAALAAVAPARAADAADDPALRDARAVATQRPGLTVMRVSGQSMLPFFDEGAVIVVKKIDSARLRIGMIAVYINRAGQTVVHRVVARADRGWRVQGAHNDRTDRTIVNGGNLLGVVYVVFPALTPEPARVARSGRTVVTTAYAAPAQ